MLSNTYIITWGRYNSTNWGFWSKKLSLGPSVCFGCLALDCLLNLWQRTCKHEPLFLGGSLFIGDHHFPQWIPSGPASVGSVKSSRVGAGWVKQQQQLVTRNEGVAPSSLTHAWSRPHFCRILSTLWPNSPLLVGRCSSRILTPLCQTCPLSHADLSLCCQGQHSFESLSVSSASSCAALGGLIGRKRGGRGGTNTFMLLQFVLDIHCQEMRWSIVNITTSEIDIIVVAMRHIIQCWW